MAIPAKTIDEVLSELDSIIDITIKENNFLGIFAYVYRRTTAQIKQAVSEKQFEDNQRMELMDVTFANLYLKAYTDYRVGKPCSESWNAAFTSRKESITIIQHLMLGMNAHINLDLGIAAAEIAQGKQLSDLKNDFMKVNQILNDLTNEMQERLSKVSKLMFLLDWLGRNTDELIVGFSMVKAREQAWNLAQLLSFTNENDKKAVIDTSDKVIAQLGQVIKRPPGKLLNMVLRFIASFEEKDVKTIIEKLRKENV